MMAATLRQIPVQLKLKTERFAMAYRSLLASAVVRRESEQNSSRATDRRMNDEWLYFHAACSGIGTNGLSRRFVFGLIQRKFTVFDLLQFGLDVQQVMTTRIFRMMAGELSPSEARRMITEKQTVYSHAHIAGALRAFDRWPLGGQS
jgi:hypothetical protein